MAHSGNLMTEFDAFFLDNDEIERRKVRRPHVQKHVRIAPVKHPDIFVEYDGLPLEWTSEYLWKIRDLPKDHFLYDKRFATPMSALISYEAGVERTSVLNILDGFLPVLLGAVIGAIILAASHFIF